jgi:2-oxoglutarate dehydrogenase E1 component
MQDNSIKTLQATSYLSDGNAAYIEELYETYLKDPKALPAEWQRFFESLPSVSDMVTLDVSHADIRNYFLQLAKKPRSLQIQVGPDVLKERKQISVEELIDAYRRYGHLAAKIDPLGSQRPEVPELQLNHYNLNERDEELMFRADSLLGTQQASLKEIYAKLRSVYTDTIGAEYRYIRNPEEVEWIQHYIENGRTNLKLTVKDKQQVLNLLTAAEGLERYLGNRFVGQKRFSLEGGEALIPLLNEIIQRSGKVGIKEVVIGMAHRGRLNVLLNIIGQSPEELFQEFEGRKDYGLTSGDVKYHLGFSSDVATQGGAVHLSLAFNPSHLEVISSVVMGSVRARQDRYHDPLGDYVLPIQIHGDAAFAGQGIVMETLSMSQTKAYYIGGAIHIVINNQIGFTTNPEDARSSLYCTDIAKMIEAPIFHVNGDDPEAVVFLGKLATDYRQKFHKDIVIDFVCYRKHGHNEADEPSATQPIMYQKIKKHPSTREIYATQLIKEGIISENDAKELIDKYREALDLGKQIIVNLTPNPNRKSNNWSQFISPEPSVMADTAFDKETILKLARQMEHLPQDFELQRQVGNMMEARAQMTKGNIPIDWGYAESMAYATLLSQGYPVRITGQDSCRGTFGHRHAVLYDQKMGKRYIPLSHLGKDQAPFWVYDSLLSEEAVVGFEYGYAKTQPNTLVIWEAQFGDFANGAQVIIDQFISSGWQKWRQLSGLVMLLPHSYEGMGPEHSSARLERYLQLCAQHNMQVCIPTTPAQIFHLLRRQIIRPLRLPLIVMTPKSLLRHKLAVSSLDDLSRGKFQLVIPEIDEIQADKVRKVVLCSGKVYYDLLAKRREENKNDIALIRIEQLYPFPYEELQAVLASYKEAREIVWCQEEPKNQGAWFISYDRIVACLQKGQQLTYVGRPPSAAPAAGYPALHKKQQVELVADALK